jgi:hypothetical protein
MIPSDWVFILKATALVWGAALAFASALCGIAWLLTNGRK